MTAELVLQIARALLWMLSIGVLLLPMRWALFCFIVAAHLDIMSPTFASASSFGFENTVRIAILPVVLLLRMRFGPLHDLSWSLPHKVWIALIAYAGIAGVWSDFQVSALKMVVYLGVYFLLFAIFSTAWAAHWLDLNLLTLAAWCVMAIAAVQTYILGDEWGEERFTSFSSPQYFAAFLVAMLAILVFSGRKGFLHYATCGAIIVAILLSGSRYIFVSAIILLLIASFQTTSGKGVLLRRRPSFRKLLLVSCAFAVITVMLASYASFGRTGELLGVFSGRNASIEDIGTFAWRLGVYQEIMDRLERRTVRQLLFGSGTSSGAGLMFDYEPSRYSDESAVDGNRVLHSEFLRALYEWGVLGLGLLVLFLVATTIGYLKRIASQKDGRALAFIGVLPSIVFGLAIENILAGAGSAAGVGILLALTYAWSEPLRGREHPELRDRSRLHRQLLRT